MTIANTAARATASRNPRRLARVLDDPLGRLGLAMVALIIIAAVFADILAATDPLALSQAPDHLVEAQLQLTDLGPVVNRHADVELAALSCVPIARRYAR